jgi:peptidoglycan/LPS O-acetylase OafA/YrhL
VSFFFVLSGFLITWVLLRERADFGNFSLGNFYRRRFFRIFPAFIFYVLCLGVLCFTGSISIPGREWIAVLFFYWNYLPQATSWWVGHFWSLAVEEQFYLVWPACLSTLAIARAKQVVWGMVLLSPFLRVGTFLLIPALRDRLAWLTHSQLDLLAFGCLAALVARSKNGYPEWKRVPNALAGAAAVFALFVSPALTDLGRSFYGFFFRNALEGGCASLVMIWVIQNPQNKAARFFYLPVIVYLGRVSYSLYLWQQLFLIPNSPLQATIVGNLAATFTMAVFSYHVIEQPAMQWGKRFSFRTKALPSQPELLPL